MKCWRTWGSVVLASAALSCGAVADEARKVAKTDEEWARLLSRDQFLVTRRKATEPAFSGKHVNTHAKGVFACVCCGAELFSSRAKFDSGTGWPSFFTPVAADRIETAPDYEMVEPRIEVMCKDCGAHLGHVFDDGPPPTGLRYCMNSVALRFKPSAPASKAARKRSTTASPFVESSPSP